MARGVSVNGDAGYLESSASLPEAVHGEDQGPCLYLGPAGQRCFRRAVEGGFCAQHQPGGAIGRQLVAKPSRIVAAILGILGVLWPLVAEFVREVSHWIRFR